MSSEKYDRPMRDTINEFEKSLGVPKNFTYELIQEDDWSFIIKSHALLESCVSYLLFGVFEEPELINVFSRLNMSDTRTGKMAFIKSLDLLDKDARTFIRKLSEVRNRIVHSVDNVNFDLISFFEHLDEGQAQAFGNAIKYFQPENEFEYNGKMVNTFEWVIANPKKAIWFSLLNLVSVVYLNKDIYHLKKQIKEHESRIN